MQSVLRSGRGWRQRKNYEAFAVWSNIDVRYPGIENRVIRPQPGFVGVEDSAVNSVVQHHHAIIAELGAGPGNTSLPLVVALDSNAQAFPLPQDPTYIDFMAAGYSDVWHELFRSLPGLTCCQSESDNNPV